MHLLAEKTVHIERPASAVFAYVADMERFGEWFPGIMSIVSANGLAHGTTGKEYLETVAVPLRGMRKIRLVVREVRSGQFFATEGNFVPLMPRMEILLREAESGACDLTWRMFSRNDSPFVRHALLPLAGRVLRKRAAIGVASLKQRLEGLPQVGAVR